MFRLVARKIRKKLHDIRTEGFMPTLKKFVRDHLYRHDRSAFFERDLSLPHRDYGRRANWQIRVLEGKRDLEEFCAHFSSQLRLFEQLFDEGLTCVASFVDNVLVGYIWYSTADYYDRSLNFMFRVKPGEVYQKYGQNVAKYRGTLMVLDGMRYSHQHFLANGFNKVILGIDITDFVNLKLHLKLGFEERGAMLHAVKILSFRRAYVTRYEGRRFDSLKRLRRAP